MCAQYNDPSFNQYTMSAPKGKLAAMLQQSPKTSSNNNNIDNTIINTNIQNNQHINISNGTNAPIIATPVHNTTSNDTSPNTAKNKLSNGMTLPSRLSDTDGRPPRVDTMMYKQRINAILGATKSKTYWKLITKYFTALLSKREFDQNIIALFEPSQLYLHNELFMGILQNACSAELPDLTQQTKSQQQTTVKSMKSTKSKSNNKTPAKSALTLQLSDDDSMSIVSQQPTTNNKQKDITKSQISPRKRQKSMSIDDIDNTVKPDMTHKTMQYITTYKQYIHALHNTNVELTNACIYGPIASTYNNAYLATYASLPSTYQQYNKHIIDMTIDSDTDRDEYDSSLLQHMNNLQMQHNITHSHTLPTREYVRQQLNTAARSNGLKRLSDPAITLLTKASHAYIHLLVHTLIEMQSDGNDVQSPDILSHGITNNITKQPPTLSKPTLSRQISYLELLHNQLPNKATVKPSSDLYSTDMPTLEIVNSDGTVSPAKLHNDTTNTKSINESPATHHRTLSINNNTVTTNKIVKRKLPIECDDLLQQHDWLNYMHDCESVECLDRIVAT